MLQLADSKPSVNLRKHFDEAMVAFRMAIRDAVEAVDAAGPVDFLGAEGAIAMAANTLITAGLAEVAAASRPQAGELTVGGQRYRRLSQPTRGVYLGLHGEIALERHLYRLVGVHNGATLDPIAVRCGMIDGRYTPRCAAAFGHLAQAVPSREAADLSRSLCVLPYGRCAFARAGISVGTHWGSIREDAEERLAEEFDIPETAVAVSVAVDRVSMPMAEDRERTPQDDLHGVRRPISVNWRMAYCGVWTLHDKTGESLHSVRYAWLPGEDSRSSLERALGADVDELVRRRPDLRVVTLADGAPEMQNLLDRAVDGVPCTARLVDFWHVTEKLAAASRAAGRDVASDLPRFRRALLTSDRAIDDIAAELARWADDAPGPEPDGVREAITYVANHGDRMRYASVRTAALPIGSGHVEATCKTVVAVRFKRAGARWRPAGAQPLLHLRALATSSRWDAAMALMAESCQLDIREAA